MIKANLFDEFLRGMQSQVLSCLNCQPYEEGEPVWCDEPRCLDDLFDENLVPALMRGWITNRLRCRTCRSRVAQYDVIGTALEYLPGKSIRRSAA
jgi:hypothetical protein